MVLAGVVVAMVARVVAMEVMAVLLVVVVISSKLGIVVVVLGDLYGGRLLELRPGTDCW